MNKRQKESSAATDVGAHVKHKFGRGYLVDEERLRKLKSILDAAAERESTQTKMSVYRDDGSLYHTELLDDVLGEENGTAHRINRIKLAFHSAPNISATLDFARDGASIDLEGTNRDAVFLCASDLKTYIEKDVATLRGIPADPDHIRGFILRALFPVMMILMLISLVFAAPTATADREAALRSAAESQSLDVKMNAMIAWQLGGTQGKAVTRSLVAVSCMMVLAILAASFDMFGKTLIRPLQFLWPTNIFCWGGQRDRFTKGLELRSKLFWIVIVGLAIGVLGSILTWVILPSTKT